MTPSGFIPKAAATSLGSIVLTRSARRVQRSFRDGTPQSSTRWLRAGLRSGGCRDGPDSAAGCQLAGSSGTGRGRLPSRRSRCLVDVAHAQAVDLVSGRTVEQREDPEQRFMRVSVTARWCSITPPIRSTEGVPADQPAVGAPHHHLAAADLARFYSRGRHRGHALHLLGLRQPPAAQLWDRQLGGEGARGIQLRCFAVRPQA